MDPVSLLMAYLLVEAVSSGAFTSAVAGAAGGAVRAAWLGGGSTGSGGGSKAKGSRKTKLSTGRSGGHIRRGAADGFSRGRAEAAERRRQRRERVRGWWRGQQAKRRERAEDPRRHPESGVHCQWQELRSATAPFRRAASWLGVQRHRRNVCGKPVQSGKYYCPEHQIEYERDPTRVGHSAVEDCDPPDAADDDVRGPECGCCGLYHGRAMRPGEHCDWCDRHDPTGTIPEPRTEGSPQTPPAGPVSGESPKEGTSMADVSATQSVTFWEDIADQVSRQVEAEQSAELAVNGAADVKDKIRGHAQQVADEFSGLIEAAKGSSHEYASTYRS